MKKTHLLIGLILIILIGASVNAYVNDDYEATFLYGKQQINMIYYPDSDATMQEIIGKMVQFSNETDAVIEQYAFMGDDVLNIYSTKPIQGASPPSNWKVNLYPFDQVENVGLGSKFYATKTLTESQKLTFQTLFETNAQVEFSMDRIEPNQIINKPLLYVTLTVGILWVLFLVLSVLSNQKNVTLKKIWGYTYFDQLVEFMKPVTLMLGIGVTANVLGIIIKSVVSSQIYLLPIKMTALLKTMILTILLMVILIAVFIYLTTKESSGNIIKGHSKIRWRSYVVKAIAIVIIFMVLNQSFTNAVYLRQRISQKDAWKQTEEIYKVSVHQTYSDLLEDRDYNDRAEMFYRELTKNKQGFLMITDNFERLEEHGHYFYEINTEGIETLCSPYGRSITIDKNYLDRHLIESDEPIEAQIVEDEDVLNILVPLHLKKYESEIKRQYQTWFYNSKIDVENIYNEAMKKPLNEQSIETLSVNLIYVKDKQKYFTYNIKNGDENNQITDPIAIIYTSNIDTSTIGAYLTRGVFLSNDSKGNAYNAIMPIIQETAMYEVKSVYSVFNENSDEIIWLQNQIFEQLTGILLFLTIALISELLMIWSYCEANQKEIQIKSLWGYPFYAQHKKLIGLNLVIYVALGFVYHKMIPVLMIGFILELVFTRKLIFKFK